MDQAGFCLRILSWATAKGRLEPSLVWSHENAPQFTRCLCRWKASEIHATSATAASSEGWVDLENGVPVKFDAKGVVYAIGEHWTIPARTTTGDVIRPQDQPDFAIREAYAIATHRPLW
jgi:hypothetical protein